MGQRKRFWKGIARAANLAQIVAVPLAGYAIYLQLHPPPPQPAQAAAVAPEGGVAMFLYLSIGGLILAGSLQLLAVWMQRRVPDEGDANELVRANRPIVEQPRVTVFTHDEALRTNPSIPSLISNLFGEAGWRVEQGRTSLPKHAKGVWVHGGSITDRMIARWGLRTLNLTNQVDGSTQDVALQVIVGGDVKAERDDATDEKLAGAEAEIKRLTSERDGFEYSLSKCKRNHALSALGWLHRQTVDNKWQPPVEVTIRFADYADFDLVKKIEAIFKDHAREWPVTIDGQNVPVLKPSEDFKVVFVSGINRAFDNLGHAFNDGKLIGDVGIGRRTDDRNDYQLVVEVLPTVRK
jgi:hypothetical protein